MVLNWVMFMYIGISFSLNQTMVLRHLDILVQSRTSPGVSWVYIKQRWLLLNLFQIFPFLSIQVISFKSVRSFDAMLTWIMSTTVRPSGSLSTRSHLIQSQCRSTLKSHGSSIILRRWIWATSASADTLSVLANTRLKLQICLLQNSLQTNLENMPLTDRPLLVSPKGSDSSNHTCNYL